MNYGQGGLAFKSEQDSKLKSPLDHTAIHNTDYSDSCYGVLWIITKIWIQAPASMSGQ